MEKLTSENLKQNINDYYSKYYGESLIDKHQYKCPNPNHNDTHPSATYYDKSKGLYCHACGKTYDIFNLISFKENLDSKQAFKRACELYQTRYEKDKTKFDFWHSELLNSEKAKDFIFSRGFNLETIKKFKIGYAPEFDNIVIPVSSLQYTIRNLENEKDKRLYEKRNNGENTKLFNCQVALATTDKDYCFICEGEFDAMSFDQIGIKAIGLRSTSNVDLLFNTITNKNITFILALDNDESGKKCKQDIYNKALELGFEKPINFDLGIYKDPNEMLVKAPQEFMRVSHNIVDGFLYKINKDNNISAEEKIVSSYDKKSNLSMLSSFNDYIEKNKNVKPMATGFKELDNILDGGIRAGIYVIGAISSLGKTTFTMQIADNIAKHGNDVIIYSLEMTRNQLIAKSLSRLTFENETEFNRKSTGEILHAHHYINYTDHDLKVIERAKQSYSEYANNVFTFENENGVVAESILKGVETHIKERNKKPFVVIDYMQLISSGKENFSDKQNMDKLMESIKQCVNKYEVPILLISSINREGYTQKISMQSLKESGGIEFCAEIVLGLQYRSVGKDFDIDFEKAKTPREIELIVLKNRFGEAGSSIYYDFYPKYNYFKELEKDKTTCGFTQMKNIFFE